MMLAAFLATARDRWNAGVGALAATVIVAPACFLLGQCDGQSTGKIKADGEHTAATVKAIAVDGLAKDTAAIERDADALRITVQTKGLNDAVRVAPTGAPDAANVALGCERLRQAGRSASTLPAVCRPAR